MERIRRALRVVGFILCLLALGMMLQPAPGPRSAYQKVTDNLAVPSARAEECWFNQLRCVPQGPTGVCVTGGDLYEGCVFHSTAGCEGCIL